MLEQLDKLPGVRGSSTNYSGMTVRTSSDTDAIREVVAQAALVVLAENNTRPTRLSEKDSTNSLSSETWRGIETISELSSIEFRTVSINRLKRYAADEHLSPSATEELVRVAEKTWDEHDQSVDPTVPPYKADWDGQCRSVDLAFVQNAKHLLSEKQIEQLKEMIQIEFPK